MKPNYLLKRTIAVMATRYLKPVLFIFLVVTGFISTVNAQTLFTYGDQKVNVQDFMSAYKKNMSDQPVTRQSLEEYLQLYINSRLKIKEAYARGYDTLPAQREEFGNLRAQIIDNYMNDPETMQRLLTEALSRSQKEINAWHIFIRFSETAQQIDTASAYKNILQAYQELKNGTSFEQVALKYSNDPSVKSNQGNLGYVTAFTLPYTFENVVYSLAPGEFSAPIRSKSGYHIFKNGGERKSSGRISAYQVLLALPPNADEATVKVTAKLADSLYQRLLAGDNAEIIATTFSNDFISAQAGGKMTDFQVGQYDPVFEQQVLALPLNTYSPPFRTGHGLHIVRKLAVTPLPSDLNDVDFVMDMRTRVNQSDRIETIKQVIHEKVANKAGIQLLPLAEQQWLAITDSILDNKKSGMSISINRETPMFQVGQQVFTIQNWLDYAQSHRYKPGKPGTRPYTEILEDYELLLAHNYYRDHLEDFNPEFASQLNDFKEGNIFFEIMQKEVWNKAQEDSAGQRRFYEENRQKYVWEKSADAILFYAADRVMAQQARQAIEQNPTQWQQVINGMGNSIITDSARYEWAQIPGVDAKPLAAGMLTPITPNPNDASASFAYIKKVYNETAPRSLEEARGFVLNDYQQYLEEEWVNTLRKKYPVKMNKKAWRSLVK